LNSQPPGNMGVRGALPIAQTVKVVDLTTKQILFNEVGIDAYWSLDGERIIFSSYAAGSVSIWHRPDNSVARNVAPPNLGDYYSWAERDGKQLIGTITSNYYYLNGDKAVLPAGHVKACPGIGVGDRPLISKDGRRISTFVRGTIVVRGLTDCKNIIDTGLAGAKADFSYDGRYIAFHDAKPDGAGEQIEVGDLLKRTVRTITSSLPGSSLFPSWTRDGRLSFRYDGPDYRGFMMASNVLSAPERPLSATPRKLSMNRTWKDIFPETRQPSEKLTLVTIWGTWSAHSPMVLRDLQRAAADFRARGVDVSVLTAAEPASYRSDLDRIRRQNGITLAEIPLTPAHFARTEAVNQSPSTLIFRDGRLIDRRLGPQSYDDLRAWVGEITHRG
ncbi:MAG: hypothetical protein WCI21_08190, partial [Alphaproteobacteria bacterium]